MKTDEEIRKDLKVWRELEKIRFSVDCMNGANSTPLDGCFISKRHSIKQNLQKILQHWSKEEIDKELEFHNIEVDWEIIDGIMGCDLNE